MVSWVGMGDKATPRPKLIAETETTGAADDDWSRILELQYSMTARWLSGFVASLFQLLFCLGFETQKFPFPISSLLAMAAHTTGFAHVLADFPWSSLQFRI